MKKRTWFSGGLAAALVCSLSLTAQAASERVTFGGVGVELTGRQVVEPDVGIKGTNGRQIPSSITYTDGAGGGTIYLSVGTISEVMSTTYMYDGEKNRLYLGMIVDDVVRQLMEKTLVDGDYPQNSKGERYGSAVLAEIVGHEPDLIAAVATNGVAGYCRAEDISGRGADGAGPRAIPVYDLEGNSIGEFVINDGRPSGQAQTQVVTEKIAEMEAAKAQAEADAARAAENATEAFVPTSDQLSFGGVGVEWRGTLLIAPDTAITAANGQEIPGSITYTDESGKTTLYLPLRKVSECLGVAVDYDAAANTVYISGQPAAMQ